MGMTRSTLLSIKLMGSSIDKNTYQQQRFTVAHSTFNSNIATNDFTKQFATYWNPSAEIRYENWLQTQRKQFHSKKDYDRSTYQLKSAFACTNQFISSFSRSQTSLDDATRCTSK
ncbi:Neurocan core protein [Dirofilaria immitis]